MKTTGKLNPGEVKEQSMKSTYRVAVVVIMVMSLLINPILLAAGNPPPGRWEKVENTKPGEMITIYIVDGSEKKVRYEFADERLIGCADKNGTLIQIEKQRIEKITLFRRDKYIKRGTIYGLLGGAAIGGTMTAQYSTRDAAILYLIYLTAIGGVTGCLAGVVLGSPETIYISREAAMKEAEK